MKVVTEILQDLETLKRLLKHNANLKIRINYYLTKMTLHAKVITSISVPINEHFYVSSHINPLYSNEFFLLVLYNKLGITHCTYLEVSGYIFFLKNIVFICLKIFFTFTV